MPDFAIRSDRWCRWIYVACGLVPRWSRVRELAVSLEDPTGFAAALGQELGTQPD